MNPLEYSKMLLAAAKASPSQQAYMANQNAYLAQKIARSKLPGQFTVRNKWTAGSLQVERASSRAPFATMGSRELYMERQEVGGAPLFATVPGAASAGTPNAKARKRPQKRSLTVAAIQSPIEVKTRPRGQRGAASIALARKRNNPYAIVPMKSKTGLGLVRVLKRRVQFLHWFPQVKKARVKASPWLTPASQEAMADVMQRWGANQRKYWEKKRAIGKLGIK